MQEAPLSPSPTQRKLSALKAHYSGFPGNNQWGNQWLVCSFGGVGILYPCAAFVVLMGKPTGGREVPPPRASTIKAEGSPYKDEGEDNMSKKMLSLALVLVMCLSACHKPQAEQTD